MTDASLPSLLLSLFHLGDYLMILAAAGIVAAIAWLFLND